MARRQLKYHIPLDRRHILGHEDISRERTKNFAAAHATAPLITDSVVHPDGKPGTTAIDDWSDKAVAGRSYALAGEQGDWTAIWYGGQKAWFENPGHRATVPGRGLLLTAPDGVSSVPLYGRSFPEQSEYPSTIPFDPIWTVAPIPWTLPAGQTYLATGSFRAANYYARFDPADVAANHTLVIGGTNYFQLSYNHRVVYVKASDVKALPYES